MNISLTNIANDLSQMVSAMVNNAVYLAIFIAVALAVHVVNILCRHRLNILGITPRRIYGLPGIILSPWLHGSFGHLFINAAFFYILATMMLMSVSKATFVSICIFITLLSGLLTWIFGRRARHIGASGVVMGLWGFLLVQAIRNPTFTTIVLALVVFYCLGGMVSNLVPSDKKTSWEGHLFGTIAGVAAAFISF